MTENQILSEYKQSKKEWLTKQKALKHAKKELYLAQQHYLTKRKNVLTYADPTILKPILLRYRHKSLKIHTEIWNAITHGLGAIFGIIALVLFVLKAKTPIEYIAYIIYATSIILLFLASTLYHSLSFTKAKHVFRILDHSSIFLLIAGTYTPYCLVVLHNQKGYFLCAIIWLIALCGIVFKIIFFEKSKKISTAAYIIMGWLCLFIIIDLLKVLPTPSLILLVLGGITYTSGVYFYKQKTLQFSHVIWHLFVLSGAIIMFLSLYLYL